MSEDAKARIEVNGKEYASLDDMPPDVRRLYEEAMRQLRERGPGEPAGANPAPAGAGQPETLTTIRTTRRLIVNGKEIASLDELPEDMRAVVRRALASAGEGKLVEVGDGPPLEVRTTRAPGGTSERVAGDGPTVVGTKPAHEQPVFAEWMKRDAERQRRRVAFRVSPARLVFWIALIVLIVYLYLRRH